MFIRRILAILPPPVPPPMGPLPPRPPPPPPPQPQPPIDLLLPRLLPQPQHWHQYLLLLQPQQWSVPQQMYLYPQTIQFRAAL